MTIWVDASRGASGDMILGALLGAGVSLEVIQAAVDAVSPEPVKLRVEQVARNGLAATRCHVDVADSQTHRTWRDVRRLLDTVDLDAEVRDLAAAVFSRLATAEAAVHGTTADEVAFHEVGALDSIADVVGACAGFVALGSRPVTVSPVAVGSGTINAAHGSLPVPPPAVAELLRGSPSYAGPPGAPAMELCTPTAAALLITIATGWGPQPAMSTATIGVGAGSRDPQGYANVLRIFVGEAVGAGGTGPGTEQQVLLECNVDDLDPRLWPDVISALLRAGAVDAWLTPIVMKKGRPAHTLSALAPAEVTGLVRTAIFRETSTIGLRTTTVSKHALEREEVFVEVDGVRIGVKIARLGGAVVNAQPEYDDVVHAAATLERPVRDVLDDATAACRTLLGGRGGGTA
jgi:uncharacterized protein (TIGR00299 family) protein